MAIRWKPPVLKTATLAEIRWITKPVSFCRSWDDGGDPLGLLKLDSSWNGKTVLLTEESWQHNGLWYRILVDGELIYLHSKWVWKL
jgi:hypothetical protein